MHRIQQAHGGASGTHGGQLPLEVVNDRVHSRSCSFDYVLLAHITQIRSSFKFSSSFNGVCGHRFRGSKLVELET